VAAIPSAFRMRISMTTVGRPHDLVAREKLERLREAYILT
jgi:hypothetical protein